MPILPLPDSVRAQLKSSVEILSLADVVEGLLKNALDAGSSNVTIVVDFAKGFCSMKDDGIGIPSSDFDVGGNLASPYCMFVPLLSAFALPESYVWNDFTCGLSHLIPDASDAATLLIRANGSGTSKRGTESYGTKGQFLSQLSSLSLLSISSLHRTETSSSTLTLRQSKVISRKLSLANEELGLNGTKVVVHGLFGNMPVRFKHQAMKSSIPVEVERRFEALKRQLVAYLLAFPKPLTVRLSSINSSLRYVHNSYQVKDHGQSFSLQSITAIFRQAGLATNLDNWKVASARSGDLSVRAAICLTPNPSKGSQFLSFGQYPIPARGIGAIIYDSVNSLFESSAFGAVEETTRSSARPSTRKISDYRQSSLRTKLLKRVDRWPSFYLRIDARTGSSCSAISFDEDVSELLPSGLQDVVALLRLLLTRFLERHKFSPVNAHSRRRPLLRPSVSRQSSTDGLFDEWKRMKSAFPVSNGELSGGLPFAHGKPSTDASFDHDLCLLLDEIEKDPDVMGDDVEQTVQLEAGSRPTELSIDGDFITWTNPRTGKVIQLNSSNGFVKSAAATQPGQMNISAALEAVPSTSTISRIRAATVESEQLAALLLKWSSSAFSSKPEDPITSLNPEEWQQNFENVTIEQRINAVDLADARVLRQVENKFILALVSSANQCESAILVDQHAADERAKVEEFHQDLSSGLCVPLARPLIFDVSNEEGSRFKEARRYFASWGIEYDSRDSDGSLGINRQQVIEVTHLPHLIAERCRHEPRVLIEMLRREIWSQHRRSRYEFPENSTWISRMGKCPDGLLDMVNSRACRSAIMFNDILSRAECQELLRKLSRCTLPFQCAHGRPSMTLLATFGQENGFGSRHEGTGSFGKAFQSWCN